MAPKFCAGLQARRKCSSSLRSKGSLVYLGYRSGKLELRICFIESCFKTPIPSFIIGSHVLLAHPWLPAILCYDVCLTFHPTDSVMYHLYPDGIEHLTAS